MDPQQPPVSPVEIPVQQSQIHAPLLTIFPSLLALLLLIVSGFFGYQYWQLRQQIAALRAVPTPTPPLTQNPTPDPTANWKTVNISIEPVFGLMDYTVKIPSSWIQMVHSSNFQNTEIFQDNEVSFTYKLIITELKNLNLQTGKPFATLRELTGMNYDVQTISVAGQTAAQVLPRAGSESDFKVVFFTPFNKQYVSIELDTPRDDLKMQEGQTLFTQILSTFTFTNQLTPTPTCRPRPACLDTTPRCLIPETTDMCPPTPKPTPSGY